MNPLLAVLSIPDPLHPALVHFPIVLLLLGAVAAVVSAFLPRWHLPLLAAILSVLGVVGTFVAAASGEEEGERVEELKNIEPVLEAHETWADRTEGAAVVFALLAIGTAATARWRGVARVLGAGTAVAALASVWCVAETGHYGGLLVYRHGAGVNLTSAAGGTQAEEGATIPENRRRDRDD